MRTLSTIICLLAIELVHGQPYADLTRRYQYGIISLSYGNALEMKTALKERSLANQVAFIHASTEQTKPMIEQIIKRLKLFIDQNTNEGWGKSFSFINLSLHDSIIFYNKADNKDFTMMKAPFDKKDIACIAFFVDQFRYVNMVFREQIAQNIRTGKNLGQIVVDLKSLEQNPFASDESTASLKNELSNSKELLDAEVNLLSNEQKALALKFVEEGQKTVYLPDQFFASPDIELYYEGNDRQTKQKISKLAEYLKKQKEVMTNLEKSGVSFISKEYEYKLKEN